MSCCNAAVATARSGVPPKWTSATCQQPMSASWSDVHKGLSWRPISWRGNALTSLLTNVRHQRLTEPWHRAAKFLGVEATLSLVSTLADLPMRLLM